MTPADRQDSAPGSTFAGRAALATQVALDKAVLAVIRQRSAAPPQPADRTATEMERAAALFGDKGWLAPAAYHRRPPSLRDADLTRLRKPSRLHRHETVTFASGFRPREIEPGADRWACTDRNDTVLVRMLRHRRREAPWVVCLHGFGMGASRVDLMVTWATFLHKECGFNVAVPVLPLHGPRRSTDDNQLLTLDLAVTLHGISQAIWDIRRLVGWIRETSGSSVGVYGLSLGGYLAALLAGIEPLDCVVAGIPFSDVLGLMAHHGPPPGYRDTLRSEAATSVFSVVSPVAATPVVPRDRLAIFAARGDRLIPGNQSLALWHAWQSCPLHWYNGGHVGFAWSRQTRGLVADRLRTALTVPIQA